VNFYQYAGLDPEYGDYGIIKITDINGYEARYLSVPNGVLQPVRIYTQTTKFVTDTYGGRAVEHKVVFAIPIPDGQPTVLAVTAL
jgi:hypothetical protein